MEKFKLDKYMVESIEFMRNKRENMNTSALIENILNNQGSENFNIHADKISNYFNHFSMVEYEDDFLKCLMGHYEIKPTPEDKILEYYQTMLSHKNSGDYDLKFTGEQGAEAIEFVLEQLGRLNIIMKPEGEQYNANN